MRADLEGKVGVVDIGLADLGLRPPDVTILSAILDYKYNILK